MDESSFKELSDKLVEIGKVIEKLPTEIREDAFRILQGYATGKPYVAAKSDTQTGQDFPSNDNSKFSSQDQEGFFMSHDHEKPADNVKLITAYLYDNYGTETFTTDEIKEIASNVGITIPSRPDATLNQATYKGKGLFNKVGRGKYKITVNGESFLKTTYQVKKGTQKKQASSE